MKRPYSEPTIEVIRFEVADVLTSSSESSQEMTADWDEFFS